MTDLENQDPVDTQDPAQQAEPPQPVEEPEQAPQDPVAEPPKQEKAPPPKWAIDEITSERARRREAERREAELREMLERVQKSPTAESGAQPTQQPEPMRRDPQAYEADVRAKAAEMRLQEDSTAVLNAGLQAFPNFNDSLRVLNAMGFTSNDVVADLLAVDKANAHKILDKLAKDPERAGAFAKMDTRARVAEFTRLSMSESQAAQPAPKSAEPQKAPSKAPPPKPTLDPVGSAGDPNDLMDENISDAEWFKRYRAKRKI